MHLTRYTSSLHKEAGEHVAQYLCNVQILPLFTANLYLTTFHPFWTG